MFDKYKYLALVLIAVGLMGCQNAIRDGEEYFRLVIGQEPSPAKDVLRRNDYYIEIGEQKVFFALVPGEPTGMDRLQRVGLEMRDCIDGFLKGYASHISNDELAAGEVPQGITFPNAWKRGFEQGQFLARAELQRRN